MCGELSGVFPLCHHGSSWPLYSTCTFFLIGSWVGNTEHTKIVSNVPHALLNLKNLCGGRHEIRTHFDWSSVISLRLLGSSGVKNNVKGREPDCCAPRIGKSSCSLSRLLPLWLFFNQCRELDHAEITCSTLFMSHCSMPLFQKKGQYHSFFHVGSFKQSWKCRSLSAPPVLFQGLSQRKEPSKLCADWECRAGRRQQHYWATLTAPKHWRKAV